MKKLKLIIVREFLNKVRNRTFIIMTFLSPLLIMGMGALIGLITKSSIEKTRQVDYIDASGIFESTDFEDSKMLNFNNLGHIDLASAKEISKASETYGLLYIPNIQNIDSLASRIQFFSQKSPSLIFTENLEKRLNNKLRALKIKELNLDTAQIKKSQVSSDIQLHNFEGEESSKFINEIKLILGSAGGYIIMMFIIIYGSMVMRSVIEEKTSRIIEVIVSSVKPFQLLLGKVLGTAAAGVLQFIIWGVLITLVYLIILPIMGIQTGQYIQQEQMDVIVETAQSSKFELLLFELSQLPIALIVISFFMFFIGGYLLYSSIYAAIGAAVDSESDSQQFMLPIILPLMLGIYIGFAVVINDPHGPIATTFSMIPFTSPIVMMMRIPLGAPIWQVIVSLLLLFLTFIGIIWVAAKIYKVGILMYGKKPSYKDLYKWLRY